MKKRISLLTAAVSLLPAILLTLLAGLGLLDRADLTACDALYQQPAATDGRIVIIGIDQRALDAYGPYQEWCRDGIARTLDILNADPDSRPAVIGVDVLFSGETSPQTDQALARAAGRCGNVVTACAAGFDTGFVETENGFVYSDFLLTSFEEPFPALKAGTVQGHINAMLDRDGVLRRHLLYFDLPGGGRIPSMALVLAQRCQEGLSLPPLTPAASGISPTASCPGTLRSAPSPACWTAATRPATLRTRSS